MYADDYKQDRVDYLCQIRFSLRQVEPAYLPKDVLVEEIVAEFAQWGLVSAQFDRLRAPLNIRIVPRETTCTASPLRPRMKQG